MSDWTSTAPRQRGAQKGPVWTPAQDTELRRLARLGYASDEIAPHLALIGPERNADAVLRRALNLGLHLTPRKRRRRGVS